MTQEAVLIHSKAGYLIGRVALNALFEIYEFMNETAVRMSLQEIQYAVGITESGDHFFLKID